ncbi:hypothetical protein F5Y18DRAFT_435700 [Xylariaceae sp. FL1019]|nr:hypothetical protein F5Y18DRAFT_435700 [Xylariaceae sp. FL1019]
MMRKTLLLSTLVQHALGGAASIRRREVVTLTKAPMVTEVVPAFTEMETTITRGGEYTAGIGGDCGLLALGCIVSVVDAVVSEVLTLTGIIEKTTTYPLPTPTTWTSHSTTYQWSPPPTSGYPSCPATSTCSTAVITVTDTVTTVTDATTTSTITSTSTVTATPSCTPTPALTCDKYGYLVQSSTLYQVDLATGDYTTVSEDISNGEGKTYNALGYNILDNYLYAVEYPSGGGQNLARIDADGGVETLTTGITAGVVGDIDGSGTYWNSDGRSTWSTWDVNPTSPTYLRATGTGLFGADVAGYTFRDWVYLPSEGSYLWTVGSNSSHISLLRYAFGSNRWAQIASYTSPVRTSAFGALYGINNGTIYGSRNQDGQIWGFPVDGSTPFIASDGPISSSNDGARCAWNLEV